MSQQVNVIYHADCADGFGAAWAAHQALDGLIPGVRYLPVKHGEEPPETEPGSRVYILDFSFPRETMQRLVETRRVILIDHHETALRNVGDLPGCSVDPAHSGAVLAWQHFHPREPVPELLRYVEDRDLWKWELPHSREVSAALYSHPMEFAVWDALRVEDLVAEGAAILRENRRTVQALVKDAYLQNLAGYEVPVVNTPVLSSEVCEALLETFPDAPFAACWRQTEPGFVKWSLRSRKDGVNVAEIARSVGTGGGGHPQAAGFIARIHVEEPSNPYHRRHTGEVIEFDPYADDPFIIIKKDRGGIKVRFTIEAKVPAGGVAPGDRVAVETRGGKTFRVKPI